MCSELIVTTQVSSNIMVDFESYYKYGPSTGNIGDRPLSDDNGEICECQECMTDTRSKLYRRDYDGKKGHPDEKWTDEQLILCPPRVLGYVLREKKWAQLDVNKIVSLPEKDDAFWSKLRLAGGDGGLETKKMLHGLVKNHGISEVGNSGKSGYEVEDIVAEKGKGLVILLYGTCKAREMLNTGIYDTVLLMITTANRSTRRGQDVYR